MHLSIKIQALAALGDWLKTDSGIQQQEEWAAASRRTNAWFTEANVRTSLTQLAEQFLNKDKLEAWVANYPLVDTVRPVKKVGLVLAGNIPAVGFHDILSVLMAGHQVFVKPSSQDTVIINGLLGKLMEIEPAFSEFITFSQRMNDVDAMIATGSDNSARYFTYYFASKPHIIRRNRTSVGVLTGHESTDELYQLGTDIFTYYGLGCRNVSKVFVPNDYDFTRFFESIQSFESILDNNKYVNNYDYNRSIYLVNREPFLDNGFLSVIDSAGLVSPISVLFVERYSNDLDLKQRLHTVEEKIQCIVGKEFPGSIPFGSTQSPGLMDYADGVDTMEFLLNLQ